MASIDNIILKSTNPFDSYRSVNFWQSQKDLEPVVETINQEAIATIEEMLDLVIEDNRTRTVMLQGDPGSGKTYLLGRLKKAFNDKAFFVYIKPFSQSDRIWRHILRYTVDSMIQVPEGQQDSQLMLWLKSLSAFTHRSLKQRILKDNFWELLTSDRQKFIKHLKDTYRQAGIYNADNFFGVLHDLTNPDLYDSACQWLQGDDLSEESLQELGVKGSIDTEDGARETLSNFGRISTETQPIVLCFDQLESIARLPDGSLDLQNLFSNLTKIHDEDNNFLVIISITTDTWKNNKSRIDQSHKDRIDSETYLKPINLKEAESLLASRLFYLHQQANPKPNSQIYPLTQQFLQEEFQRSRTTPREALIFGRDLFQEHKRWLASGKKGQLKPSDKKKTGKNEREELLANFQLKWLDEFGKIQQRITKVRQESSPELIQMLKEALAALQMEDIKTPLLTGTKFANYSLSYQIPGKPERIGIVWTEDQNMTTFFHVMEACRKAVEQKICQTLYLIREAGVGNSNNKGYKVYTQIFTNSPHRRIIPNALSVQCLVTYYDLVKDAREGDLVLKDRIVVFKELQVLIRESKVLHDCPLLQNLALGTAIIKPLPLKPIKDFLLNLVVTQQFLGRQTLIENAHLKFSQLEAAKIDHLIHELCYENKIKLVNPKALPKDQLVCFLPQK
jgi:Cdc6-like AAA superfamily ATPase